MLEFRGRKYRKSNFTPGVGCRVPENPLPILNSGQFRLCVRLAAAVAGPITLIRASLELELGG